MELEEQIEAQTYVLENSIWTPFCGCRIWLLAWLVGYGQTSRFGEIYAHRLSYRAFKGEIPEDKPYILHICDTRCCVNPDHLLAGTQKQNIQDAVRKGRIATGKRNGNSTHPEKRPRKLSKEDIVIIFQLRKENLPQEKIGKIIGCSRSNVRDILLGKTWSH